jgi:ABC-2 type transport system permease protein
MISIFHKELVGYLSSLIGYIVLGVFFLFMGLTLFVFPDTSILQYNFATLEQFFASAPLILTFMIPALTMRSFAEEKQTGTFEFLATKPVTDWQIILGKFGAYLALIIILIIPTLVYYYSIYLLGSPVGNIDAGASFGSYIGLFFLGALFSSIGLFASTLSKNQIVSFVLATFICFIMYWGFYFISKLPGFVGYIDDLIQLFGVDYHYYYISRGVIDSRDIIYFISVIVFFLSLTHVSLQSRKWDRSYIRFKK